MQPLFRLSVLRLNEAVYWTWLARGGRCKREILGFFFILLNKHRIIPYVFTNIKQFTKMCCINILGQNIVVNMLLIKTPQRSLSLTITFKDASFQVTHWHSPYFHGYFAAGNSYPSILGDMLSDAIGCIGFSWVCSLFLYKTSKNVLPPDISKQL